MSIDTNSPPKLRLMPASEQDRPVIYSLRHAVYAGELQQHPTNADNQLTDRLDGANHYIVAKEDDRIIGFISITPPTANTYSVDKYVDRLAIPYPFDERLYEIRLLTVIPASRSSHAALALMFAAFRWVQSHGGQHIVAIGRTDLMPMYTKAGLRSLHIGITSGAVHYELAAASVTDFEQQIVQNRRRYDYLQSKVDWQFPFAFFAPTACYHGGQFFKAVGEDLQTLHRATEIINADVLDAWFPPSPQVLSVVQKNVAWLLQTSPPTQATGLIRTIADVRGVHESCILPGAGSSNLIFLALHSLLTNTSRVLLPDPCYGEYAHVLERVIGCRVHRFTLHREDGFRVDTPALLREIGTGYDLVVLVNPNSPTGVHTPRQELEAILAQVPLSTLVWIDETYIDYVNSAESLEPFAARSENVIVCKSMSKAYALSGVRVAYLCASPHLLETLRSLTPPWAVSLPAQAAAIAALRDADYYREKYDQTHVLRNRLKQNLLRLGITDVVDGMANFLLFFLPDQSPNATTFLARCQAENLFLRDVSTMGTGLGDRAIRVAVKDEATIRRMVAILQTVLNSQFISRLLTGKIK